MNCRFRKYFIRVLLFTPRLFCGKSFGRTWECQEATLHTMEMKQFNGGTNVNGRSMPDPAGNRHYTSPALARSRSMQCAINAIPSQDGSSNNILGNSLVPPRQKRTNTVAASVSKS